MKIVSSAGGVLNACIVAAALLLEGTLFTGGPEQDRTDALIARIEAPQAARAAGDARLTLHELMEKYRVPGLSVAVIENFQLHWAKGYGVADAQARVPVEVRTLFQAASISKPVTAMAVLAAVQDGRLSLDDDVNSVLTSWRVPRNDRTGERSVTLRALLSHTSGAGDGFGFPGYDPVLPRPTLTQILNGEEPSNVGPVFFERPPFTAFRYSGGGSTIAQLALMDVLGRPFAQIMREFVLDPLGMADSTYEQPLPADRHTQAARAHDWNGRPMGAPWHVYPEQAAAGLWTTPSDLAKFVLEVQRARRGEGQVLSAEAAREMLTPVGIGPFSVGFWMDRRGEAWSFSHSGSNWGFRSSLLAHADKGYGVVVMANSDGGSLLIQQVEARVAEVYNWR